MDIRFFIVGSPFVICFLYTLFWLNKWGAFNSSIEYNQLKKISKDNSEDEISVLENIFIMKN